MTDWKSLAKAARPEIPDEDLERIAAPLASLEQTLAPRVKNLPPDLEPLFGLNGEEESA